MNDVVDIFIIGGGINGAGIARDAAGRGLSVILAEKDDLASHTSSSSSKLIHGGLRYLEHYEFRLVRESLMEREILLKAAPHLVKPIRFVLPHHRDLRPALILRAGLFLYDHIGGRKILPASKGLRFQKHPSGAPLKSDYTKGFEYSDCWVDDARLVLLTAIDAQERGAKIMTRTEVLSASRAEGVWTITVGFKNGKTATHKARVLVNATGPWVDTLEEKATPAPKSRKYIRMVKGSHIVVPKIYEGEQAYTFQNADGRVVFAIPYEGHYTLIGTTDVPFTNDPNKVEISPDETAYLCSVANGYFNKAITPDDVAWSYAGVRPLVDDGKKSASKTTRDYVLELDTQEDAPMLSIYGGKITTYRCLAEDALHQLKPFLQYKTGDWTADAPFPGGEIGYNGFTGFMDSTLSTYSWLPEETLTRMIRAYGTRVLHIIQGKTCLKDMGKHYGAGLYEAELAYMRDHEWAICAGDALWRRSKLGLHMNEAERSAVKGWFGET